MALDLRSRRRILQTGVAAALFAASGAPVMARSQSGRLRIAVSDANPMNEDPLRGELSVFSALAGQGSTFDTLTEVSPEGALRAELALEWAPNKDADGWTLTLRSDAVFHDGTRLGADQVAQSFLHHKASSTRAPILETIVGVDVLTPLRVRFRLCGPNPDFPWFLSDPSLVVFRAAGDESGLPTRVGTGLYRHERADRNGVVAHRVPRHYKDGRAGWFEALELLSVADEADRVDALLSGRVDVTHDLLPHSVARLRGSSQVDTVVVPDARYIAFECRGAEPQKLKNALSTHIDRETLVRSSLGELGRVGFDVPFPGYVQPDPTPRAAKLPKALTLAVTPGLGAVGARVASVFCQQLRTAGAQIRLAAPDEPADIVARRLPVRPLPDWAWLDWIAHARGDASAFEQTLLRARVCLDPRERAELYNRVADLAYQTGNVLIPCFTANTLAYRNTLAFGGAIGAGFDLDGARIAERWWRS